MVLNLLIIGLAVTLDPLPLSAFLVVLPSRRGVRKGAAFVFGWLVSLALVVTATVLATGNNPPQPNTAPSLASLAVRIALGAGLVVIAIRDRRRMGQPRTSPTAGSSAGWRWTARYGWPDAGASAGTSAAGQPNATSSTTRS